MAGAALFGSGTSSGIGKAKAAVAPAAVAPAPAQASIAAVKGFDPGGGGVAAIDAYNAANGGPRYGATASAAGTDIAALVKQLTGGGAGAAAAPPPPPGGGTSNTAAYQPDLQYAISNMKSRFEGDGGAGRAIDVAGGKLREFSEGERKALAGRRSMRGVSGTGIDDYDERGIRDRLQGRLAGSATDITLGREAAKDSMLGSIAGAGASSAAIAQADRRGALEEWSAVTSNQRAAEAAQQAQLMNILNILL